MSKFLVKNKFSIDPHVKGLNYSYQFNYTPKSVNLNTPLDCKTRNLRFPSIVGESEYDNHYYINMTLPLIEHKYRYCNMFEQLIRSVFYKDSYCHKPFSVLHTSNSYLRLKIHNGYTFGDFKFLSSASRHDAMYDYDSFFTTVVDESALSIIGFSPKYALFDTYSDDIIKNIFDVYRYEEPNVGHVAYNSRLNERIWGFTYNFNIDDDVRDTFYDLLELAKDEQYEKFTKVFKSLIDDKEPITFNDLNSNIEMVGFKDTDIHTNTAIHHNLFEALNATTNKVLIAPSKKSYTSITNTQLLKKDPNHKRRLVDQYKVFFEDVSDVSKFFEIYQHFTKPTSNVCLSTNVSEIPETDKAYVHYFKESDATLIQDKISNSSLKIEISNRKTPYWKDCYGFLILNAIVIMADNNSFVTTDSEDKVEQYTNKVISKLSKFGIDGMQYFCHVLYSPKYSHVLYEDGDVIAIPHRYSPYFNINALNDDFKVVLRKSIEQQTNNTYNIYNTYIQTHPFSYMIGMVVPIIRNQNGYTHITQLLKRQKLTGNLGGFTVDGIVFAPYASKDQKEIDTLMETINDL